MIRRCLVREYQDNVVAVIPAKELRPQIRRKGVASTTDAYKAHVLMPYIEQRIDEEDFWRVGRRCRAGRPLGTPGGILVSNLKVVG